MALFPGLPRWASTRRVKPIWILPKQETVSGSGFSWAMCKSAPHCRQITTPAPHHSVFYRPDALPAAQPTASKHWRQAQTQTDTHTDNPNPYSVAPTDTQRHTLITLTLTQRLQRWQVDALLQHQLQRLLRLTDTQGWRRGIWLAEFVVWTKLTHVGPG